MTGSSNLGCCTSRLGAHLQMTIRDGVQDAVVRLAAATALVELYDVDDHVPLLHKFTVRFASRYAELIYDLNEAVSVKGVCLQQIFVCKLIIPTISGCDERQPSL